MKIEDPRRDMVVLRNEEADSLARKTLGSQQKGNNLFAYSSKREDGITITCSIPFVGVEDGEVVG